MFIKQIRKPLAAQVFENAAIYLVVFAMLLYGIGKPFQFTNSTLQGKLISNLSGMELMWAFYGYSKPFVYLLGFLEISGALLLVFYRTRIVGCFILSTILINVILQVIFYGVNFGALMAAIIYQLLICFILICNKNKLMAAIKLITAKKVLHINNKKFVVTLYSILLFITLKFVEYLITH